MYHQSLHLTYVYVLYFKIKSQTFICSYNQYNIANLYFCFITHFRFYCPSTDFVKCPIIVEIVNFYCFYIFIFIFPNKNF